MSLEHPVSYTTKILKALKLDDQFADSYRNGAGQQIIEHIATKKRFLTPYQWIELIKKHRGYMQLAAMEEFKKLLVEYEKQPPYRG